MNPTRKTATNWLSAIGYRLILGVLVSVFAVTAFAADCRVNDPDISGEYVGGCLNGLAQGKGKAKGRDSYDGEFELGFMHGQGTYIWPITGSKYEGSRVKDKRDGFGKLSMSRGEENTKSWVEKNHGRWQGDYYVIEGVFEQGRFMLKCTSPQNCKQEQAKREAQERREATDREASIRQACSRLYIGKPVSWPEGRTCVLFSCDNFTLHGQIVGIGNGVASAKVTESYKYGQVHEKACNEF